MIHCPAGKWTILVDNWASRMPATWTVEFSGEAVGQIRERRSWLPFGLAFGQAELRPLSNRVTLHRFWVNASYRCEVCPESDLTAKFV